MRRHSALTGVAALLLALSLGACGVGQRQSPVASDEEAGRTKAAMAEDEKPATYTTKAGDTLRDIAARPEIYGDPDLWPLIKGANNESVGQKSPGSRLKAGLVLEIPRGSTPEDLAEARLKARNAAAEAKNRPAAPKPAKTAPMVRAAHKPAAKPLAPIPEAKPAKAEAKPEAKAASPAPVNAEKPAPKRSGGMLPLFFLLLLVLAALGGVLYVFSRRDKQDGA